MKLNMFCSPCGLTLFLVIWIFSTFSQTTLPPNPVFRNIYTADPSAHVWSDGRLYVYPSHDIDPPRGCDLMDKYHVYSTDDMVHWTDHGVILSAADVSWGRPEGGFMWAPDCAFKNGVYYYYFPHPSGAGNLWNSTWKIGVATSTSPTSGFVSQGYIQGLESFIDPCVFIDDDGQAYLYYGGGGTCKGGKLKDNMMEIDGQMQSMVGLQDFHEATWVHKRNGIYYLSYADNFNQGGNQLRYAMSNNPLGPWTYQSVYILSTGSSTDHGSIVEYKGEWYAFYHNSALSGNDWLRSVCIDKLYYNGDGTIQMVKQSKEFGTPFGGTPRNVPDTIEAEDFNSGGQGVGYLDKSPLVNEGGKKDYRTDSMDIGVDLESYGAGQIDIGFTNSGEYTNYTINVTKTGIYDIKCIVASGNTNGGSFMLKIDDKDVSGTLKVPGASGQWSTWKTVTAVSIPLTQGVHVLTWLTYGGMNLDKFIFTEGQLFAWNNTPIPVPGRIEAEYYDTGGQGISYNDLDTLNKSGAFRTKEGVDIETTQDTSGQYNISWMQTGEWLNYTIDVAKTSIYDISSRVAGFSGSFTLEVDNQVVGASISVATGGWQAWKDIAVKNISLEKGIHILKFKVNSALNLNYMTVTESATASIGNIVTSDISVFPNPSEDGKFNVRIPESGIIQITDVTGKILVTEFLSAKHGIVDLSGYSAGLYLATLTTGKNNYKFKLVKK